MHSGKLLEEKWKGFFFEGKDMNLQFSTPLIKSNTFTLSVSPSISTCLLFKCSALHSFKAGSATASTKQKVSPLYDHNYGQWQLSVIYIYPFIFWVL